jgi:PAS domain S-box-containing protein
MRETRFDHERSWATRASAAFAIWSITWILVSDFIAGALVRSHASYWLVQTGKGVVYVAISAAMLWLALKAREREEDKLRASNEQRLLSLKEAGLIGIAGLGIDGKFLYGNRMLIEMLGYSKQEFFQLRPQNLVADESKDAQRRAEKEFELHGRTALYRITLRRKDGSPLPVIAGRALIGSTGESIAYFLDISPLNRSEEERLRLQERLLQAEKVNALGQFASGVAHNFNNELSLIVGYGTVLQEHLASDLTSHTYLGQILNASDRARKLIQQLLAFSRNQPIHPEIVDMNHVLTDLQPTFRRLLKENIDLQVDAETEPHQIRIDRTQFVQVLLNLVSNAQDAMPEGGVIKMSVEHGHREQDDESEEVVTLSVTDNGIGMEDATAQRIFEPFFSTKLDSGGTGLGLSSAYGIVRQNGGDIKVCSRPGKGTTFTLTFARVCEASPVLSEPSKTAVPPAIKGSVLLVEDCDDLREMMAQILTANGLTVIQARDGIEAVKAAQAAVVDLVVTDIVMPRLSGPEAVDFIRTFQPNVKIIFVSGSADMLEPNGRDVIMWKPVMPGVLLKTIESCLSPKPASLSAA